MEQTTKGRHHVTQTHVISEEEKSYTIKDGFDNTFSKISTITASQPSLSNSPPQRKECKVAVATQTNRNKTKRIWDKKYLCCYCKKLVAKIARHLQQKHINELKVAEFCSLPKNSKERQKIISQLRSRGNYFMNITALKEGGTIIPKKRPLTNDKKPTDYLPCEYCGSFYTLKQLSKHVSRFIHKDTSKLPQQNVRRCVRARCALLLPTVQNIETPFKENILQRMTHDEIFECISHDELIIQFGIALFNKLGHMPRQHRMIKDKLRELGRLILKAKEKR